MGRATIFRQKLVALVIKSSECFVAHIPPDGITDCERHWGRMLACMAAKFVLDTANQAKLHFRKRIRHSEMDRFLHSLMEVDLPEARSDYSSSDGSYFEDMDED